MTQEDSEQTLRTFLRRRPFQPFTVILSDGQRIDVDIPKAVAFGGGGGGFIYPTEGPIFFECEEVSQIIPTTQEAAP